MTQPVIVLSILVLRLMRDNRGMIIFGAKVKKIAVFELL